MSARKVETRKDVLTRCRDDRVGARLHSTPEFEIIYGLGGGVKGVKFAQSVNFDVKESR